MSDQGSEHLSYLAPLKLVRCRFSVQNSRFIATLAPVNNEGEVSSLLQKVKGEFSGATHHACAFRLAGGSAPIERSSDDGEPAGTAGQPMLQLLQGRSIAGAMIIGTRYFGGIKLGIGGLTRAYRHCARLTLEEAVLVKKEPCLEYLFHLAYEDLGALTNLVEKIGAAVLDAAYSEQVLLKVRCPARCSSSLLEGFEAGTRGRGAWEKIR